MRLLPLFFVICLFILSCNKWSGREAGVSSINVIWIIAEDMSPDLAYFGNNAIFTPFLDSLANSGKVFHNVFATGVACSPSRTAFATGFYQNYLGAHHMRYPEELKPALPDSILPIHVRLQHSGYQVANIKSFPGNGKTDWQFAYPEDSYDTYAWEELDSTKPFFARINIRLAHRPFEKDSLHPVDPDLISLPPYEPDHGISRSDWKDYFESIQKLDRQVSFIFGELRRRELLRNTVVFFFSDHGRPMTRAKNYLYDSGLQVPLIVVSGDSQINQELGLTGQNNGLYSLIDVSATTLELAGLDNIKTQGQSLLNSQGRDFVWAAADRIGEVPFKSRMVRTSRFKYIRNYNHSFSVNEATTSYTKANYPTYHLYQLLAERGLLDRHQAKIVSHMVAEELYDIQNDPFELDNLAEIEEFQSTKQEMIVLLDEFSVEIKDKGLQEDSEEIVQAFEDYGRGSWEANREKIQILKSRVYSLDSEAIQD